MAEWTGQHRPRNQFWRWLLAAVIVLILIGAVAVGTVLLKREDPSAPKAKAISSAPSCPGATSGSSPTSRSITASSAP